jgi:hypothetical protein
LQHSEHTTHFAAAIRSAVTARQIHTWILHQPGDDATGKYGQDYHGSNFLQDAAAADEAGMAIC